ncbi:protein takeout-like isoform X2 [Ostrinia furnacalis]|uniref:protein takeout-like isoform X2 n=1 Tax=Ostrinia furnacalis TaxID=93504 RepID=UPI00103DD60E|nr:protein takeout-like isoform X2 [Ostrinia furnacalis]
MLRCLCFFAAVFSVRSASAPFITPCKQGDAACLKSSAQAALPIIAPGIPELGIKPLDPLRLDLVKGDQGGLQLSFRDTVLTGMKGCTVENVKHDLTKGKSLVVIKCSVNLQGNYKLGGQLLILPIQGEGKYTINIQDIVIKTYSDITTVEGADGKPHWHITDWRNSYQVKTGTQFQFDNLFNGNKVLAVPVHDFVNNNWREVMQEIAGPIVRAIVAAVVDDVEALYKAVPAEELFIA